MRVRRLVELIAVTLLVVAAINIKNIKISDSFSLTKTTVSTVSVSFATSLFR